ncbi:dTDP-4-dehydrorhamnose 3,5-epimerase [Reichenbachiella carrageenanivorans]|uniref:dTDP-4-dehydrorhamnose 3,5-epimerase n=1 Tax=Reichenbachiella carrageenanivorans TaxID=2979869 RepID=A0ABY6D3C5_9BACT|nr:dTDP-4-dehydrorhamnose 3,5-epimerase [Reichenbachiella carrageenanivorans]UXX80618.1 dTDP-4-dehydrorhamnose 3,5-epimerase [Reichenbachiella carrageenanivorans]
MKIEALPLSGAFLINPTIHNDKRGYFFEWFNIQTFESKTGIDFKPVQFNCSKSAKGVLRGMHFQTPPHAQAKLVTATKGEIQDVIIDLRKKSPTFGQHYSTILSEEKKNQLYVPKGFAHGFLVLSKEAEIFYAIDNFYAPDHEDGVCYNDPTLNINWMLDEEELILSDKDKIYSAFASAPLNF